MAMGSAMGGGGGMAMGAAMGGNAGMGMSGGFDESEWQNSVQLKMSTQKVTVPCTRNVYNSYTVKVPRQVTEKIPRTMQYTTMETRKKTVPYTVNKTETRYRNQVQSYQEPVTSRVTRMVSVKSKEPRTVYVDVTKQVPQTSTRTDMVTKHKTVRVPYAYTTK